MTDRMPGVEFLGWEKPAAEAVAERLLEIGRQDALALSRCAVVVPTKESGRRLRALLAERSDSKALLSPRVMLPGQLVEAGGDGVADEVAELAAWTAVLMDADAESFSRLFPVVPEAGREEWAVGLAARLMKVRRELADHECDCAAVREALQASFGGEDGLDMWVDDEAERWLDLEQLAERVDAMLRRWELQPSHEARAAMAGNACRREGVERLIVACVPELPFVLRRCLQGLAQACRVDIWVHAPAELAGWFDAFGVPLEVWNTRDAGVPDSMIHVAAEERGMAAGCLRVMSAMPEAELQDVALGACDDRFVAALCTQFGDAGWPVYRPEGRALSASGWGLLMESLDRALDGGGRCEPFEALLRSPLVARAFGVRSLYGVCRLLDEVRRTRFPANAEDLSVALEAMGREGAEADLAACLSAADYARKVGDWLARLGRDGSFAFAMLSLLDALSGAVLPHLPEYGMMEKLRRALETLRRLQTRRGVFAASRVALHVLRSWSRGVAAVERNREEFALDALGWMELAYSRERNVLVTGFHEGRVPDVEVEDAFLPDRLRRVLGWEDSRLRTARDAFLLASLLEPRRERGSVHFFVARQDPERNPVQPSSLLLRCSDEELPARVRLLFETMEAVSRPRPFERGGWHLCAGQERMPDDGRNMEHISMLDADASSRWADESRPFSPSLLARFLRCPLRFWLRELFGIDPDKDYPDRKRAMEFNEYGTLVHGVLEDFVAEYPALRGGLDERGMARRILEMLDRRFAASYGERPLAPLMIQKRLAARSLESFSARHLKDLQEGWENVGREAEFLWTMEKGVHLKIRIDRIDRHADGRIRIIDYKTGKSMPCEDKHLEALKEDASIRFRHLLPMLPLVARERKGREELCRWKELQLPLYALAVMESGRYGCTRQPETCYYNLPRQRGGVTVEAWVPDESLMDSVRQWTRETALMIRAGRCLYSAEDLGLSPYDDEIMNALAPDSLRAMLDLPQPAFPNLAD